MKKKNAGARTPSRMRRMRYGWYALLLTVIVIAAVAAVNIVIGAAEDRWALKIDASPNNITGFSDQTYTTLDGLQQDVHVYLLFPSQDRSKLRTQLEEIAAKYRARNNRVIVDAIDPVTEPNRVNKYKSATNNANMSTGSIIVTNEDESRVRLIPQSELYSYTQNQQTGQYQIAAFNGESKLTQGINFVTSETTPLVYFLTGHEEVPTAYCTTLSQTLASDNIEVQELALGQGKELKSGDTLVVIAPQIDITDDEYNQLRAFLDDGGRMVFAEDAQIDMSKTPNFVKLLGYYGIQFKDGVVVEDQSQSDRWLLTPNYIVPQLNAEHAITTGSGSARLILPNARAVARTEMPLSGWAYTELLTTSDKAYVKSLTGDTDLMTVGPGDEVGKQALAVAVQYQPDPMDSKRDTRIVAIGSVHTLVDSDIFSSSHNPLFSYSMFNWLIDREENVYIRGKSMADTVLSIPNQMTYLTLSALVVIVIPLIMLILGIAIYLKRRRL